ncbi:MAG: hypothetical protein E3J72_12005 [Planctomycetota bacterium]|nr:MAG: hypothetical protein E3J72_12005 [Planctomycetota bacterium]
MTYYFLDILQKCVIARLTDDEQAQEIIAALGSRYGVIETEQAFTEKEITVPTGPAAGGMDTTPDYGPLVTREIAYEPFVVADVFTDYDIPAAEVNYNASRYDPETDAQGFVRDFTRILNTPPPKDFLRVTTDATDDNPPDGYPDIPADGASTCRIMIQKANGWTGEDMTGPEDNELIQISTEAGRLSAVQANLVDGYAEVILTSSSDTVITQVRVHDPTETLAEGSIQIQFA